MLTMDRARKVYDLMVVGGGIAGLAVAEVFARSGYSVALVEKNEKLCMDTSGMHHEWFHFGSLYSIFPDPHYVRTLVGGIDDVLVYYRDFDGMNLRVSATGNLMTVDRGTGSWLREDKLEYLVGTTQDPDFSPDKHASIKEKMRHWAMKRSWNKVVQQFLARHNRFKEYDWRRGCASHYIGKTKLSDYVVKWPLLSDSPIAGVDLDLDTHVRVQSFDSPMRSYNIISDLLRSYLSYGGKVINNTKVITTNYRTDGVDLNGLREGKPWGIEGKQVVLAASSCTQELVPAMRVKRTASPLLVAYPAVCDKNVVRLIPFVEKTINHLLHEIDGKKYSLIGGGFAADPDDESAMAANNLSLTRMAKKVFPKLADSKIILYTGIKSELPSSLTKRNYLYRIEKVHNNGYVVFPGKFTLCFSLAVNTFRRIAGHYPNTFVTYNRSMDVTRYVDYPIHKRIVNQIVRDNSVAVKVA